MIITVTIFHSLSELLLLGSASFDRRVITVKRFACAKLVTERIIDRNQNFGLDSAGLTSIGIKPTLTIPNVLQISLLPLCTPLLGHYLRELATQR